MVEWDNEEILDDGFIKAKTKGEEGVEDELGGVEVDDLYGDLGDTEEDE